MDEKSKLMFKVILMGAILFFIFFGFITWSQNKNININNLQLKCEQYNFSNDISIIQRATFFNQYKIKGIYLLNYTNNKSIQCQAFLEMCQPLNIQEVNINRTLHLCFDTSIITEELKLK